ncbi:MAG TPA: UDP-N-acetylmuramate dehydrogenase [Armatimonadetes bacterium]|nr:UDP-N-acetylmuramate dehydrogenase [Armatimonadota bacterium]
MRFGAPLGGNLDHSLMRALSRRFGVRVRFDEPLSLRTTLGVGGPAKALVTVERKEELIALLKTLHREGIPYLPLGGGSNLLVSERGFPGVVITLSGALSKLEVWGSTLRAGAGAPLSEALKLAIECGLSGLEFAAGIPGTVGGAVANNSGGKDGCVADIFQGALVVTPEGDLIRLSPEEAGFFYRGSRIRRRRFIVVEVEFKLSPAKSAEVRREVEQRLRWRKEAQPLDKRSAGSIFKNPAHRAAGALLEAVGAKGLRRGGAVVSEKHANFIVNEGGATAADVWWLIREMRRRVLEEFGIWLELEVEPVGGWGE